MAAALLFLRARRFGMTVTAVIVIGLLGLALGPRAFRIGANGPGKRMLWALPLAYDDDCTALAPGWGSRLAGAAAMVVWVVGGSVISAAGVRSRKHEDFG